MKSIFKFLIKYICFIILHVFYIFPINKKKIYYRAFSGTKFACNPKYIYIYFIQKFGLEYKHVWELKNGDANSFSKNTVICKKLTSIKTLKELMTSKYIITNTGFPWWIPIRKKQVVLETWHGGGAYKRVGVYEKINKIFEIEQKLDAKQTTFYISSSKKFTEVQSPSKYVPMDRFIPTGMPRNSIFFDKDKVENIKNHVYEKYGISKIKKILLYAPTYRGETGFKKTGDVNNIMPCFSKLIDNISKKFNGEWIILYRSHYFDSLITKIDNINIIDVTSYEDMQELLCASDILITDFSSSMWDFALSKKPCFLFAPDIQQYIDQRGFYTDPYSWPFSMSVSDEELESNIDKFDYDSYLNAINKHFKEFESYECKNSCEKVCKYLKIGED